MALVRKMRSSGTRTFGELMMKYSEHSRWEASTPLEVKISNNATPIPKQWDKYIRNCKNKTNLCDSVSTSFCHIGQEKLPDNKKIVIEAGFKEGEKAVSISRSTCSDIPGLQSNQKEADTRLLLHAKCAAENAARIVIQSPDTDVLAMCTSHFDSLSCEELRFQTGVKDRLWFIPVHKVSQELGERMCNALLGFHALTGCDSNSSLAGIGKKTDWAVLTRSATHQNTLGLVGQQQELDEGTAAKVEAYVCDLYPTSMIKGDTADELR